MTNQRASVAAAFVALADPTRRQIFERLATSAHAVGKLAEGLPVSRPAVSQHLRVLEDAGLVTHEQQGTRRLYRIDPRGLDVMRSYLDRFWDRALAAFKEAAEADTVHAQDAEQGQRPTSTRQPRDTRRDR